MILHIPHSSTYIPNKYLKEYNTNILYKGISELTDFYTDELFHHWNSTKIIFDYSRFFCDVERFKENEPMEEIGQGIYYTNYNGLLREKNTNTYNKVLSLYNKHHKNLIKTIKNHQSLYNENIIVDCHSFPNKENYPDICIGYNKHLPYDFRVLIDNIVKHLSKKYKVQENYPYSGSLIPKEFEDNSNINSIMIEINKKLYLNEDNTKNRYFKELQKDIYDVLDIISDYEISKD